MTGLLLFLTWIVALYSLRLSLLGSPTHQMVRRAPQPLLAEAMASIEAAEPPENAGTYQFLRSYFYVRMARVSVFLLEAFVIAWLLFADPYFPLPWFLLAKNVIVYRILYQLYYGRETPVLMTIRDLPAWVSRWDRLSNLLTAFCFLLIFGRLLGYL